MLQDFKAILEHFSIYNINIGLFILYIFDYFFNILGHFHII